MLSFLLILLAGMAMWSVMFFGVGWIVERPQRIEKKRRTDVGRLVEGLLRSPFGDWSATDAATMTHVTGVSIAYPHSRYGMEIRISGVKQEIGKGDMNAIVDFFEARHKERNEELVRDFAQKIVDRYSESNVVPLKRA